MKPNSRQRLRLMFLAAFGLLFAGLTVGAPSAQAQDGFPKRTIRIIVGTPPSGTGDAVARIVAQKLSQKLGTSVVVENKPGAAGLLGANAVAKSPADGYTLSLVSNFIATMTEMYKNVPFDPKTDLAPVVLLGTVPYVFLAQPDAPYKNVAEFVRYAKEQPGKQKYASAGLGTLIHLLPYSLISQTNLNLIHVPYTGSAPALTAFLGKQVDIYFDPVATGTEVVKTDRAQALATTGGTRSKGLPNVPTLLELGYPVQGATWLGIMAPKDTPKLVVARLNSEINAVLQDPEVKERLAGLEFDVGGGTPEKFGEFVASETKVWGKVVSDAGIKIDN